MIEPQLILIRHGVTEDNLAGQLMGRNDSPLTVEAKEKAQELGRQPELKSLLEASKQLWASPLPRAYDTARLMTTDQDIVINLADELMERDFGVYNGTTLSDLQNPDGEWQPVVTEHEVRPQNGESLADVEVRVFPFLLNLHKNESSDQHLILVGHSTVWRLVSAALHKRRKFPLEEKIAGPLSMQAYPRRDIEVLMPIMDELEKAKRN